MILVVLESNGNPKSPTGSHIGEVRKPKPVSDSEHIFQMPVATKPNNIL